MCLAYWRGTAWQMSSHSSFHQHAPVGTQFYTGNADFPPVEVLQFESRKFGIAGGIQNSVAAN